MAEGERATGIPNTIYDLSSVLFHALEGGASYDTYIEDAEREGDRELVEFFQLVRDEDSTRADRAQQLLAERTTTAERTEGTTTGAVAGTEEGPSGRAARVDPLGREDPLPREERAALGREDPLPKEERAALGREDPPRREERRSETENTGEESLLDKAKKKLEGL
jgi:rubrerythrin